MYIKFSVQSKYGFLSSVIVHARNQLFLAIFVCNLNHDLICIIKQKENDKEETLEKLYSNFPQLKREYSMYGTFSLISSRFFLKFFLFLNFDDFIQLTIHSFNFQCFFKYIQLRIHELVEWFILGQTLKDNKRIW